MTDQWALVVSDYCDNQRVEGPYNENRAMERRNYLWDTYEGLSISMIMMGAWDE